MKFTKILSLLLAAAMILTCLAACDNTPDPATDPTDANVPVSKIDLDSSELALRVGQTGNLSATVNLKATNKDLTWSSSDEAVATVAAGETSAQAVVTAVAAGTATITATAADGSGVTASCTVTVSEVTEVIMTVGQDGEHPEPTEEITGDLKFNSDGTCVINAFYACLNAQITFETTYAVADGVLTFGDPVAVEVMGIGGTVSTVAEVVGDQVTVVCTVVEQSVRCCEFTLSADQIAQFGLTVGEASGVQSISVPGEMTVNSGALFDVNTLVTFQPADATVKDITVTVDAANADSQVVYQDGANIYPLKSGTITITVTSVENPNATATLTLTVNAVDRPAVLATNYFEVDKTFSWALNTYVMHTDGTMEILDKAGVLQALGYYTLSDDASQIILFQLNDYATNPEHTGSVFNLTTQADTGLLQFDIGEPLGAPGVYIAVEQPAA